MGMQKFKMYMNVGVGTYNHGKVELSNYPPSVDGSMSDSFGTRHLREVEVEADVPEFDLVTLEVEFLERAVHREKADSQVRQNILLERISKLKAIGHDVIEG